MKVPSFSYVLCTVTVDIFVIVYSYNVVYIYDVHGDINHAVFLWLSAKSTSSNRSLLMLGALMQVSSYMCGCALTHHCASLLNMLAIHHKLLKKQY